MFLAPNTLTFKKWSKDMNNIVEFDSKNLRLINHANQLWFTSTDIAKALEIGNKIGKIRLNCIDMFSSKSN